MTTTVLSVPEVHCGHCVSSIEGALKPMDGVNDASVSLEETNVTVEHDALQPIETDGETTWIAPELAAAPAAFHAPAAAGSEAGLSEREAAERWMFDCLGYLVIPQVMDSE